MKTTSIALWILAGLLLMASLYLFVSAAGMAWAASFHNEGWKTTVRWANFWLFVAASLFVGFLWVMTRNLVRLGEWGIEITWRWLMALLPFVFGLLCVYYCAMSLMGRIPEEKSYPASEKYWSLATMFGLALILLSTFALVVRRNLRVMKEHKDQQ